MNLFRFLGNDLPPINYADSKIVIIPAPLEKTVSYGEGTARGPEEILKASGYVELYDEELNAEIHQIGIYTDTAISNNLTQHQFIDNLRHRVADVVTAGKYPVIIGGEHSLSIAPVKALQQLYQNELSVLHLDAHADLRDTYEDSKYSHACVMRRVIEREIRSVSVGIRSLSMEEAELISASKLDIFYAKDIHSSEEWMKKAVAKLTSKIYISLDVDVFDPSVISCTGTPEPGGLTWYSILNLLKTIAASRRQVIGFDIVEFAPKNDHEAESFTCAKLIHKMIGYFYYDLK